jgi:hypothetical protein
MADNFWLIAVNSEFPVTVSKLPRITIHYHQLLITIDQ